jgi:hypothetical protein
VIGQNVKLPVITYMHFEFILIEIMDYWTNKASRVSKWLSSPTDRQ